MRRAVLVVAAVAALSMVGAAPAFAAPSAVPAPASSVSLYNSKAAVPAGDEQVVLDLRARDATALAHLARVARTLPPAVRDAQRLAALPGPQRAAQVASAAQALGLTPVGTTDTVVTVAGSPSLVQSLFGSARADHPNLPTAQALPTLPPSLQGLVLVASGGDETRPAELPLDTPVHQPRNNPDGSLPQSELQQVFGAPTATDPPTASSPTVATLQYSNWYPSDLTSYVRNQHVYDDPNYDPIADGGFSSVTVDGGPGTGSASYYGAGEASLDQEAIATMAPGLHQRAYFTGNTTATSEADAINAVAQDAQQYHILTLSTSYGNCEPDAYPNSSPGKPGPVLQAEELAIDNLLSAGVTFFAPSGDTGSVDCPKDHADQNTVDVPAALPGVVAVGGTSVQTGAGGTTQTAWGCATAGATCTTSCANVTDSEDGCSGGGFSSLFAEPSYQQGAVAGDTTAMRGVPDIAMDGDPGTGLDQWDSTAPSSGGCNGSCVGSPQGGTSLATPLAASALASVEASEGTTTGIGDIHSQLYSAPPSDFTDITSGSNGAYSAGPGWDPVTGLGAPIWYDLLRQTAGATPYVPLNPFRVVDTRSGLGGVWRGAIQPGTTYTFSLANSTLPLGRGAYAFNVTAIAPAGNGNLQLTPACGQSGTSSLVNYQPGATAANFVIVPNPTGCDAFNLVTAGSAVNVAIDAVGYYTSGFTGTGPTRIVDTRSGQGGTTGPVPAGTTVAFQVTGNGGVPAGASAVAINVTAIGPTGGGNLRVYPDNSGGTPPNASNVNYIPGVDKAVFDVVQLPADGQVDVFTAGSAVNVAIDVAGYFTGTSAATTMPAPVRVLDTRGLGGAPTQSLPSPLQKDTAYPVSVTGGTTGVPANAAAVLVSLTSIHASSSTGFGNLRIYPAGQPLPTVSTINYVSSTSDVANFAVVKVGANGQIDLYTAGSPVDAALDVLGYVPGVG